MVYNRKVIKKEKIMKGPEAQCMGGGVGEQKDQFEKKMNKDTFFLQKQGLDILSKALEEKSISKKDILAHSVRTADTYYSMYEKAISTKEKDKIIENFETSQLQISGALEDIVFREESPEFRTEAMNTLISLFSQSITEKPFHNITFNDLVQRTIFTLYRANANDLLTDEINYDEFNDLIFRALDFQCSKTKSIVTTNDPVYNLEKTGQSAEDIRFSGFEYVYSKGMSFRSNESAKRLLKKMESAENDSEKQVISKILYQLEFGKIGISEQGVKYLEKMYDLGEMNNPDYFVNRLTGKGDIGVFDKNQVLQGYFNIGELTNEEEVIKPEVMEFTYETLFFSRESETEEERKEREQYLQEFKESYFEFYDDEFVEKTGARFNNLDFKEQGQFLVYYKNSNEEKREQLMSFIAEHKENGLKTFLSIEQGGQEMGEKILLIGESLKDESQVADELFAQYAVMIDEIQDSIEDIKKMYDDIFYDVQLNENELQNAILQRSMKLLMSVAENISKVEDKKQFIRDVIADLQREAGVKRKSIQSLRDMKEKINNMMEQGVLRALGGYGETYEEIQEMTDDVETLARLKKETRFDSKKLQTEIENLKKIQKEEYAYLDSRYEEFDRGESREQKINPDITREKFSEMIEHLRKMNPSDEEIEELEQLLQLQIEFERTFDNLVYEKNVENDNKSENVSAKVMQ
ncbi:MAG: hypothetical protein ABFQ53_01205, partial [Patescibacteria group bacterium]